MMKHHIPGSSASVFILLWILLSALTASAQDPSDRGRPALGGHSFTESVDVPSPFVRSYIRNQLGAGQFLDLETPNFEFNGQEIAGLKGNLLFAILDFEYQYAIKPWVGVRARVFGTGRLGSDSQSLLSEGVTMMTGFELGWLIRLREEERSALALDLSLANRSITSVDISRFVDDVINGDPASLVHATPSARTGAGLRYAWAASPLLGVSAKAATGYGESIGQPREGVWFWDIATALDFDLRTKTSLPMGISVGYSYDSLPEFGDDLAEGARTTFLRLSYLGRDDFLLSLDISNTRISVAGDKPDLNGVSFTFGLRYYI